MDDLNFDDLKAGALPKAPGYQLIPAATYVATLLFTAKKTKAGKPAIETTVEVLQPQTVAGEEVPVGAKFSFITLKENIEWIEKLLTPAMAHLQVATVQGVLDHPFTCSVNVGQKDDKDKDGAPTKKNTIKNVAFL